MKKQFYKLGDYRIRLNSIKRYRDYSETEIAINFTPVANVYQTETIKFDNAKDKMECLGKLDLLLDDEFININCTRIRLSTIKKYTPLNGVKLSLYFSTSKSKVVVDVLTFKNKKQREEILLLLDIKLGVV